VVFKHFSTHIFKFKEATTVKNTFLRYSLELQCRMPVGVCDLVHHGITLKSEKIASFILLIDTSCLDFKQTIRVASIALCWL
jgi:hypothetical protein